MSIAFPNTGHLEFTLGGDDNLISYILAVLPPASANVMTRVPSGSSNSSTSSSGSDSDSELELASDAASMQSSPSPTCHSINVAET
jgi:hypothetical protein